MESVLISLKDAVPEVLLFSGGVPDVSGAAAAVESGTAAAEESGTAAAAEAEPDTDDEESDVFESEGGAAGGVLPPGASLEYSVLSVTVSVTVSPVRVKRSVFALPPDVAASLPPDEAASLPLPEEVTLVLPPPDEDPAVSFNVPIAIIRVFPSMEVTLPYKVFCSVSAA